MNDDELPPLPTDWGLIVCLLDHFYGALDYSRMSYGEFKMRVENVNRIKQLNSGQMDHQAWVEARMKQVEDQMKLKAQLDEH